MYRYVWILLFNWFSVYLFLFWSRLHYWSLEGYIPAGWRLAAFFLVVLLPLAGNAAIVIRSKGNRRRTLFFIAACLVLVACDPFLLPKYATWAQKYAMRLSFPILDYFDRSP